MVRQVKKDLCKLTCKINLVRTYDYFKQADDLENCIDMLFTSLNTIFNKSLTRTGTSITDFMGDIGLDNWSYEDYSELADLLKSL